MTRINELMPAFRMRQVERVPVAAPFERAWTAARELDLYRIPFVRGLVGLRVIPEMARARLRGESARLPRHLTIDDIVAPGSGFTLLAEEPGREVVIGAVGRFWEPRITWASVAPADFAAFDEPGWGKLAWNLRVDRGERGCWVTCELRVTATDDEAWADFQRYWRIIGPFSHAIRKAALRHVSADLGGPATCDRVALPGDEMLPVARYQRTHRTVVEAPPGRVWPWLVQMGARRAGWYSIDALDNGGVPSLDRIVPELQRLAVGDVIPALPNSPGGFTVLRMDGERALVIGSPPLFGIEGPPVDPPYLVSWAFVLNAIGDDATELNVRVRASYLPSLKLAAMRTFVGAAHEVMERAQLHNLKRRAEAAPH